jgi:curli biogenesis system outer membrane secretion channel CsgG
MKRIRILGVALVAMFALSAVVAVAAQATEAPYYKIAGTRLGSGSSSEISSHAKTEFTLAAATAGVSVKCKNLSNSAGSKIIGSAAGVPGTSTETLTFSNCSVSGNGTGTGCTTVTEPITTEPLVNELALSNPLGSLVVEFKPATGTLFATLTFPAGCTFTSTKVTIAEGSAVVGQILAGGTLSTASKPLTEAVDNEISFPSERITSIYLQETASGGYKLVEESALKAFGVAATFSGTAIVLLGGTNVGKVWGGSVV